MDPLKPISTKHVLDFLTIIDYFTNQIIIHKNKHVLNFNNIKF